MREGEYIKELQNGGKGVEEEEKWRKGRGYGGKNRRGKEKVGFRGAKEGGSKEKEGRMWRKRLAKGEKGGEEKREVRRNKRKGRKREDVKAGKI